MKYIFMFFLISTVILPLYAQEPAWVSGKKPQSESGKFTYEIGFGTDADLTSAQKKAFTNLIEKLSAAEGETYTVQSTSNTEMKNTETNGNLNTETKFVFSGTVTSKGKEISKHIQEVEFYRKGSEYYGLYRITEAKKNLELPLLMYKENTKALAFIPGAAQFAKQEKGKGILFLSGEVALVAGIVVSHVVYSDFHSNYVSASTKGDTKNADTYKYNRDLMYNVRNGFIVGAAGLYIYNVVDGMLSKGKPNYAQKVFKVLPYADTNNFGVALNYSIK